MRNEESEPLINESVDRALRLILLLRDADALSVKDAADHLQVAPSTAHRLLVTLVQRHFAEQLPDRRYRPGRELAHESAEPITVARLREIARPAMTSLSQSLRETVQLVILRGPNIEFIDGVEGENLIRISARFGVQIPAFASAGGKALLGELSNGEIQDIYADGLPEWPTSRIKTTSELIASLDETRQQGYGINFEEAETGIVGIGSVIRDERGDILGALTVAVPTPRFDRQATPHIVGLLRQATSQIGHRYRPSAAAAPIASIGAQSMHEVR